MAGQEDLIKRAEAGGASDDIDDYKPPIETYWKDHPPNPEIYLKIAKGFARAKKIELAIAWVAQLTAAYPGNRDYTKIVRDLNAGDIDTAFPRPAEGLEVSAPNTDEGEQHTSDERLDAVA